MFFALNQLRFQASQKNSQSALSAWRREAEGKAPLPNQNSKKRARSRSKSKSRSASVESAETALRAKRNPTSVDEHIANGVSSEPSPTADLDNDLGYNDADLEDDLGIFAGDAASITKSRPIMASKPAQTVARPIVEEDFDFDMDLLAQTAESQAFPSKQPLGTVEPPLKEIGKGNASEETENEFADMFGDEDDILREMEEQEKELGLSRTKPQNTVLGGLAKEIPRVDSDPFPNYEGEENLYS